MIILLQLSQFFPYAALHPAPLTPSGNPHTIVQVHGSCVGSLATPLSILYFSSPWLFHSSLFVLLNPWDAIILKQMHIVFWNNRNKLLNIQGNTFHNSKLALNKEWWDSFAGFICCLTFIAQFVVTMSVMTYTRTCIIVPIIWPHSNHDVPG